MIGELHGVRRRNARLSPCPVRTDRRVEMRHVNYLKIAAGIAALATAAQAQAQSIPFSGTITGIGAGTPDPTCAPATARGILLPASSTATSNLGAFTYGHNWC